MISADLATDYIGVTGYYLVWLPIRFDGYRPVIDWREEWSPREFEDA